MLISIHEIKTGGLFIIGLFSFAFLEVLLVLIEFTSFRLCLVLLLKDFSSLDFNAIQKLQL